MGRSVFFQLSVPIQSRLCHQSGPGLCYLTSTSHPKAPAGMGWQRRGRSYSDQQAGCLLLIIMMVMILTGTV
jgi:hypothetical protein